MIFLLPALPLGVLHQLKITVCRSASPAAPYRGLALLLRQGIVPIQSSSEATDSDEALLLGCIMPEIEFQCLFDNP